MAVLPVACVLTGFLTGCLKLPDDSPQREEPQRVVLSVGQTEGDLQGRDGRVIQAAIEQVAGQGGGTVRVGPGRYELRGPLRLRDKVTLRGVPGETILAAASGAESRLHLDGDCNERQITLENASDFAIGDGVVVSDRQQAGGFAVTTAVLVARVDDRTFRISEPLYLDYMVENHATARRDFPIVSGQKVRDVTLEGLTIEGNASAHGALDGCRGGGIYLFDCDDVRIRNCTVRDYNGDGISFQVSRGIVVEDCLSENNKGLGLHPGSGSERPTMRRCTARGNGGDGLYVCWRVRHGVFEENRFEGNRRAGISIGHKDSDNLFRGNEIRGNKAAGVYFRQESEPMGAHRNVFEGNTIVDNGSTANAAAIVIKGAHCDVVFRNNTIGSTRPGSNTSQIELDPLARGFQDVGNTYLNSAATK